MEPSSAVRPSRLGFVFAAVVLMGALALPALADEGVPAGEIEVPAPEPPRAMSDTEREVARTISGQPADEEEDLWSFRVAAPGYVWLPDIEANAIVEGRAIDFDLDHGDVIDIVFSNLKGYYAFYGEARRGPISVRLDTYYIEFDNLDLGDVNKEIPALPIGWQPHLDIKQDYVIALFTPSVSFTAFETDRHWGPFTGLRIEPMAGWRYMYFQGDIRVKDSLIPGAIGKKLVQFKENLWQLLPLGVEVEVGLSENLSILASVLLGGWNIGPDSKGSTDGMGELMLKYRMSKHFTAEVGVRWLDASFKGKEVDLQFDNLWGPMLRVMWEF